MCQTYLPVFFGGFIVKGCVSKPPDAENTAEQRNFMTFFSSVISPLQLISGYYSFSLSQLFFVALAFCYRVTSK
jgi:hypothetical protein